MLQNKTMQKFPGIRYKHQGRGRGAYKCDIAQVGIKPFDVWLHHDIYVVKVYSTCMLQLVKF